MNRKVLIDSLQNEERSRPECEKVVDATFKLLTEMVSLEQGLTIDGVGMMGAHYRRGANKELANEQGIIAQKNLSIFFHPSSEIKARVNDLVEDEHSD
jgi:nucleoid DNA-binding protein